MLGVYLAARNSSQPKPSPQNREKTFLSFFHPCAFLKRSQKHQCAFGWSTSHISHSCANVNISDNVDAVLLFVIGINFIRGLAYVINPQPGSKEPITSELKRTGQKPAQDSANKCGRCPNKGYFHRFCHSGWWYGLRCKRSDNDK